jgi:hypothetical protein
VSITFDHQLRLAEAFVRSGFFAVKSVDQAISLMSLCEAEGLHPSRAMTEYHVIQNKVALKSDAMLSRFQRGGGTVRFTTFTDDKVEATFAHPAGGELVVEWTMQRARQARLSTDMWTKYPRQMLRARVIAEGVRSVFPGALGGMYTEEEVAELRAVPPSPPPAALGPPLEAVQSAPPAEPISSERLNHVSLELAALLDIKLNELSKADSARVCLKLHTLWATVTEIEQPQVRMVLNAKERKRLTAILAIDESTLNAALVSPEPPNE